MQSKVYLIGEFAALNKISTRMLRHYDKIGLLKPITIEPNGYRYYSEEQIGLISKIKKLRECDFLLEEISDIFKENNEQFLIEQAKKKVVQLTEQAYLHQKAIRDLEQIIKRESNSFDNAYEIALSSRVSSKILISKKVIPIERVEGAFDKLYAVIEKNEVCVNGCSILLNHFTQEGKDENDIGVPIKSFYEDEEYKTILLPAGSYLSTFHYGGYHTIGHAYNRIIKYAEQKDYKIKDFFIERYLLDSLHTPYAHEYITEISVYITNTL